MKEISSKGIDEACALFLMESTSGHAHNMVREARKLKITVRDGGREDLLDPVEVLIQDSLKLHSAILTLESDPEIVKRNILARVISAVFPLMNTLEDLRTFEQKDAYDMFMNGLSTIAEISTATQYLDGTRLAATAHFETAMVEIENRMSELVMDTEGDDLEQLAELHGFLDALRKMEIPTRQRPIIPFLLWMTVAVVSYRRVKDLL
jgi:hypothetical protein